MINSIYTNKEIFLRELISNASDAIDRYHLTSLTDDELEKTNDYEIFLETDGKKTFTIRDNGIGMTYDELIENIGTIAKSGTIDFLKKLKKKQVKDAEMIGQFGVGFYSAFMVAKKVVLETKSPYGETAYKWTSTGENDYTIEECDKEEHGTTITLHMRKDDDDDTYSDYIKEHKIKSLVKKYSDYVKYPIRMEVEKTKPKLDDDGNEIEDETETVREIETLNSQVPIWKKNKAEVSDDELNEFFKSQYNEYTDPMMHIWTNVEGALTYKSIVFIPGKAPYNLYSEKYEKGLQLYAKGVFIKDKCKELVPDYLRFIKGLVVSPDLSLNISRETLQKNRQLVNIAANLEKKILKELERTLKNDRDLYETFWDEFGVNIKYGVYDDFGMKKDMLKDLLIFETLNEDKKITLKEYVENMKDDQKHIYFGSGRSKEAIKASPQLDAIKSKGFDVLVLTDDIDEFMINILNEYDKKTFKSINQGDLDLADDEDKESVKKKSEENKDVLEAIKEALKDDVKDVKLSTRLTESPVCLVSGEGVSFEMEKVMEQMPTDQKMKADRILEINPNHKLFKAITQVYNNDRDAFDDYASVLFNQALLIEGLDVKDPVSFSEKMVNLMVKAAGDDETSS
jgi:molecular chaperone HtpG